MLWFVCFVINFSNETGLIFNLHQWENFQTLVPKEKEGNKEYSIGSPAFSFVRLHQQSDNNSLGSFQGPLRSVCMYNYTNNQHLNLPNQYSITLRITRPKRSWGVGLQSLLLGVFVTKINVSSGIKIDDNLYLSWRRWRRAAAAARCSLHTSLANRQQRHVA